MKKLFSTPKRAIITTAGIAAAVLAAAVIVPVAVISSTLAGAEEIKAAVLQDAGLSEENISGYRAELDFDDGHFHYDVDFYSGGVEYEYRLLAKNAEIISRDTDGAMVNTGGAADITAKNTPATESLSSVTTTIAKKSDAAAYTENNLITEDEAKTAALDDAGVAEDDAAFTKIRMEKDDGVYVYDIEFYTANAEYDYEIDAEDSVIREKKTNQFQAAVLTEDEARAAALAEAGLTEAEVTFISVYLDREDSMHVYDIEFYTDMAEYDYEISATDGTVRERNIEAFRVDSSGAQTGENIGVDRAKEIAAEHAGLSVDDVQFSKAKLENDDGRAEYDIEFYYNAAEYEYSIDSVTGNILEYDLHQR